ncbi:MAG: diguanylate cyclase, partial [Firmicutes bacterium]|nr:diguanylate cyclase [Bacillota bacterium]
AGHMERVEKYFDEMANKTNGVLTYYYRIDPEVSTTVKGFWFTNLDGEGFTEHVVTDITLYDTADTSALVWFTVPKHEGVPIWIPPYITDNLDWRVISYNVPIYYRGQFVGVIGIEIDYSTMAEQVDSIRLYSNGYAFLNDAEGNLFYHPRLDVASLTEETMPETPEGLISDSTFVRYTFDGEEKAAAWLPLSNGMRLTVSVPVSETGGDWQKLIVNICIVGAEVLLAAFIISMLDTRRITRPLEQLTEAANQADMGSYDYQLTYDEDDELGRLTRTFKKMSGHMKDHISDLSSQVFIDSLTNVRNKGAFTSYLDELQEQIDDNKEVPVFAIGVFDCDNLKLINDWYGHSNGDIYLKTASRAICRVFQHSPVFRIGGDEFAVILQNDDYYNREQLVGRFKQESAEISEAAKNKWEQVQVAVGVAEYEPQYDRTATDVLHRADKAMYENKRKRKKAAAAADNNYMRI